MAVTRESLGKDINGLVFGGIVRKNNVLASKRFTNEMTIHFNMLGVLVKKGDWQQSK